MGMLSNPDTNDAEFEQIYKDTINDDGVFLHAVYPCGLFRLALYIILLPPMSNVMCSFDRQ